LASEYNHSQIEPGHLLLGLVRQADGVVPQIVQKLEANPRMIQQELEQDLARRPKVYGAQPLFAKRDEVGYNNIKARRDSLRGS